MNTTNWIKFLFGYGNVGLIWNNDTKRKSKIIDKLKRFFKR